MICVVSRGGWAADCISAPWTAASCSGGLSLEPLVDPGCGPPFFHSGKDGGGAVKTGRYCVTGILVDPRRCKEGTSLRFRIVALALGVKCYYKIHI